MFASAAFGRIPGSPWSSVRIESRSSVAYRMALVAAGRFDAAIVLSAKHDWDMAAGDIIMREAGGLVTSKEGNRLEFGKTSAVQRSMVCAGPALHALLIEQLRQSGMESRDRNHART
jgi:myo-inositol-1(or 4)-monophosphatase